MTDKETVIRRLRLVQDNDRQKGRGQKEICDWCQTVRDSQPGIDEACKWCKTVTD